MKKLFNSFLILFVTFTLTLSIISIREAKANVVQSCVGWDFIESRVHSYVEGCTCHGNPSQIVTCEILVGCHTTCTPRFCDGF